MSRDKSVWFAEEILLDAKLINYQLESGEWDAVEEMLRAEAQLSRDADTGRLRPKKASEYTLRLIADVLHIMRLDVEQGSHTRATLAVAEQCLRLVRSCSAAGTKIQTFISKELTILDSMLSLGTAYHRTAPTATPLYTQFRSCMAVLMQTLGNLVVNNPYNQIIVWDKLDSVILETLATGGVGADAAAMLVYNILLGQPHVLPAEPVLVNALAERHAAHSEYTHLIMEYLVGGESAYLEKLYPRLDRDARLLVLAHARSALVAADTQEGGVSASLVRVLAREYKLKSDLILKTVDKYVCEGGAEPAEVVLLLEILALASGTDSYLHLLQTDTSLFINCAFLLRAIHQLGKESNNFFSCINKLYVEAGRDPAAAHCARSECSESESSERYSECSEYIQPADAPAEYARKASLEHKIDIEDSEPSPAPQLQHTAQVGQATPPPPEADTPPAAPPHQLSPTEENIADSSNDVSPDEPVTQIQVTPPAAAAAPDTATTTQPAAATPAPTPALATGASPGGSTSPPSPPLIVDAARSQNLSADFNLSEQLEKILGISSEKARGSGGETAGAGAGGAREDAARAPPVVKIDSPDPHTARGGVERGTKHVVTEVRGVEQHVAFGFKSNLVRVLANLCWKHAHNKRLARELELVPVLLDCCNMDARNPLIMQWVIYAIRNLCENCAENQELISQLTLQAPLQSELLQDMGLSLHTDATGRSLRIAPLHKH